MALKTLNDFLADQSVNLYPSNVDNTTKEVIQSWYGYRKVANNHYFPNWFYRTLVRDYPRYEELLRIEARTAGSEYDWLVTNYEEREVQLTGSDSTTENRSKTLNRTDNRTFTAGTSELVVDSATDDTDGTVTTAHTGTEGNLLTRNLAHNDNERYQNSAQGTNNGTRTPNLTHSLLGSDTTAESGSNSNTRTPNLTTETKDSGNNTSRHGALQRQAPYDADYTGLTSATNANVTHTVNEDGVDIPNAELTNNSGFMAGFPNLTITNPTAASDELIDNSNIGYSNSHESGTETNSGTTSNTSQLDKSETRTETGTETNNITTSQTEDNTATKSATDTGTENNARTVNLQDADTTDMTRTHSGRSETTRSGSDLDVHTATGTDTDTATVSANRSNVERTIYTGRSGQSPQYLLADAVEFIKSTSAWLWLYRQLDKCFMMCYDIEDYEEV